MLVDFRGSLDTETWEQLAQLSRRCRGDIVRMTTIAGSGHPAGSLSSLDMYLTVYAGANISPANTDDPARDRIVISHGHTSPALYSVLAALGFIRREEVIAAFRRIDSPFEGHVERSIPGVEWTSGNLGQGLSAGCGFALGARVRGLSYQTFVMMSDAEQAKGQVAEARRFAQKYGLSALTVLIDYNHFQISGRVEDVMPVNIRGGYEADGWRVLEVDGHDIRAIHAAIGQAIGDPSRPYAILCATVMGKGVSFMENRADFHGRAPTDAECRLALAELGEPDDLDQWRAARSRVTVPAPVRRREPPPDIETGRAQRYEQPTDPRVVFGKVLEEIGRSNPDAPIAVFDCDLADSVKTGGFGRARPQGYFQAGVSEHTTATIAGAVSTCGVLALWADFGVFCLDEVYNQLRLNAVNGTDLKIVATHLGYNVGADGKTHHCIDYLGLLRSLFGFGVVVPADPNQTDHIVRHVLRQPGNMVIGLGRMKLPIIRREDGSGYYGEDYRYQYGKHDVIRTGKHGVIFAMGPLVHEALQARAVLRDTGIEIGVTAVSAPFALDPAAVREASRTGLVVTCEDHHVLTGLGSIVASAMARERCVAAFVPIGITEFGGSDEAPVLYQQYGMNAGAIVAAVRRALT